MVMHVDGNAVAGPLSEIFRADMTQAFGECRHCHETTELARAEVELDDVGFTLKCRSCTHVLFTVIHTDDRTWVDLQGISGLGLPPFEK